MIRFETMVRETSENLELCVSNNCEYFLDIKDEHSEEKVNEVVRQGIHYGFIRIFIDDIEPFKVYDLQLFPFKWLRCVEIIEELLNNDYVSTMDPVALELKKLEDGQLKFICEKMEFELSFVNFVENIISSAGQYFKLYYSLIEDKSYEDLLVHLTQLQQKIYMKKV